MTLPASGTITFNNVNVELGVSGTTTRSLNDAAVRSLAGIGSGAISMANLHGKAVVSGTFTPNANGSYSSYVYDTTATYTINCTANAVWTYVLAGGGSAGGSVNVANNTVANSITFSQTSGGVPGTIRHNQWTSVTGVSGSTTRVYTIDLTAERT
jgi:hypothetical protein